MNIAALSGRIPFEIRVFGQEDNPVVMFDVSVRRSYKKPEEQYYPEDLIRCKAFGYTAKFIRDYFKQGDAIELHGEIRKDDNYEKNGETVYGQMYFHVNQASFLPRGSNDQGGNNNQQQNNQGNYGGQNNNQNNNYNNQGGGFNNPTGGLDPFNM